MPKLRLTPIFSAILSKRIPLGLTGLLAPGLALANPIGGNIAGGAASISTPNAATTVIDQATQNAIIQWQSFDVGSSEYVIFNQPNASAAVLNRVIGGSPSEILGNIQANGRVFLVNPQGMVFGPGAQIDVGSLVASTLDVSNSDFMQGSHVLKNPGAGDVHNAGDIRVANGGFVVLAGAEGVSNTGIIAARLGDIVLASGSAMTLDLNGNGLINFSVDAASLSDKAGVTNLGDLIAQGGTVIMTASTARELVGAAVNNSGRISAAGIEERGGEIFLTASGPAADIVNNGTLDASGASGQDAGDILIHADRNVELGAASLLDITGRNGGSARVIAENRLTVQAGSLIDGRADNPLLGRGGFVELSGHKAMSMPRLTDVVKLGAGGGLLIDPDDICITSGSAVDCANNGVVVYESDVEGFLGLGSDFYAIAANSIEVASTLDDDNSDGVRAIESTYAGANLLLGIGAPAGAGSGNPGFTRAAPSSTTTPYGGILFQGAMAGYGIDIAGNVRIEGGLGQGPITIGDVRAASITILADGATSTRDLIAQGGFVSVTTTAGDLSLRNVTATDDYVELSAGGGHLLTGAVSAIYVIDLAARGAITTGALTVTDDDTRGNSSSYASLFIEANSTDYVGAPLGGDIRVNGAINVGASTAITGHSANAQVQLYNAASFYNAVTQQSSGAGGNIIINGAINIVAAGTGLQNNANADLYIANSDFYSYFDNNLQQTVYAAAGGSVSTGAITVLAHATPNDPVDHSGVLTHADATLYSYSLSGFNTNGAPIAVHAEGGDALGGASNLANSSRFDLGTESGGSILLGNVSLGPNGDLTIEAYNYRDINTTPSSISIGQLSGYGDGDHLGNVYLYSEGTLTTSQTGITANYINIQSDLGDLILNNLTALNGGVYVQARGGHLTTGDVSASEAYYNTEIDLQALGAVTTGTLTITDTDADGYSYASARLGITANNANFGAPLGGDITVNGAVNVGANTSATGYQADAHVNFHNASGSYSYDSGTGLYTGFGGGGNINLNGPVNVTAAGTGLQNNAYASLNFNNSSSFYDYDAVTPGYVYVGGSVSTGTINVIAQATDHDPVSYPSSTTLAAASVYSTSEFDFNSNGNLVTVRTTGGDANGNTGNFNDSSLEIRTHNDGDILLGDVSLSADGNLHLSANNTHEESGISNYGDISTGLLSSYGAGSHFSNFDLYSSGATNIGNSNITANYIELEADTLSSINNLTSLAGAIDVTTHTGNLNLGNLSATGGDIQVYARGGHLVTGSVSATDSSNYYYSGAELFALGGITTGALTVTQTNDTDYSYRYAYLGLYANEDNFGTPIGGDITVNGAVNVSATTSVTGHSVSAEASFYNAGTRYVGVDPSTGAAVYAGAGGDININGPINIVAAGTGLQNDADVYLEFYNSRSYGTYVYNPETASYGYVYSQVGGGVNLGGPVTLLAQATANDPDNYPGNTTYASAELYSDSLFDFNASGNLITLNAQGGDALSNTYPTNYSYLYVETEYGGDILLGDVSLGPNGSLDLYTDSAYDNLGAVTDYGNIVTGFINGYGEGDHLDYISVYSDGTLTTPHTSFTANEIYLEAAQGNLNFDSLTALDGEVYVYADNGNVNLSGLTSSNNDGVYLYGLNVTTADVSATNGRIYISAFGGNLTTGNVTSTSTDGEYYYNDAYIDLEAFGGVTVDGNLTARVDDTLNGNFYYPSAEIYVAANQNYGDGAPGGGDILVGGTISASVINTSGGSGYNNYANARVYLQNNTSSYYTYDPVTGAYTYHDFYGGGISTGAINVSAIGYPQTPGYGETFAEAHLDLRANADITTRGNAITVIADGADFNFSRVEVDTDNGGGDILLGAVTVGPNGSLSLEARTDSDLSDGIENLGQISTGVLSSYGAEDYFNDLHLSATDTLSTPHDSFTAGNISIEVGQGDVSFNTLTALDGGVEVHARGGHLSLGDVSSSSDGNFDNNYYYDYYGDDYARIDLSALGAVTTGSLTVTDTDDLGDYYSEATLSVTANNADDGIPLGGDITVNGAVNVHTSSAAAFDYLYAAANFSNASTGTNRDPVTGEFLGTRGGGGNILIHGPINVSATASGANSHAESNLYMTASISFFDDANQSVYAGGAVTTGAITVTSTATAHDPVDCSTCTTYAYSQAAISAEGDIRTLDADGNPADITLSASGGDANGNEGNFNESYLYLSTHNGGDLYGGTLTASPGGEIYLSAQSDRATGTDLGNVTYTGASGGPQALRVLVIDATGDVNLVTAEADDFILDDSNGNVTLGDITTFNGEIDITVRRGGLQTGNLTANYGGIFLDAAGYIFTGSLTSNNRNTASEASIFVAANQDLGYGTFGGDIIIGGAIHGADIELINPLGSVFAQSIAGQTINTSGSIADSVLIQAENIDTPDGISATNITLIARYNPASADSTGQIRLGGVLTGNLNATADVHFHADGATLSGGAARITVNGVAADPFGASYFNNATVNYTGPLQISIAGTDSEFFIANTTVNGNPSAYGGNVSITAGTVRVFGGSDIHAGALDLAATGRFLDVIEGSRLTFTTGNFSARDANLTDGYGGGEIYLGDSFSGNRVSLSGFSALNLNADQLVYLDHADINGGVLNAASANQFGIVDSTLNLTSARFNASGVNRDPNYIFSQIDRSTLNASLLQEFSAAGDLFFEDSSFNAGTTAPAVGQDLFLTGGSLGFVNVTANARQLRLEATNGNLQNFGAATLNYVNGQFNAVRGALSLGSGVSLNGQTHRFNGGGTQDQFVDIAANINASGTAAQSVEITGGHLRLGESGASTLVRTDSLSMLASRGLSLGANLSGVNADLQVLNAAGYGGHVEGARINLTGTLNLRAADDFLISSSTVSAHTINARADRIFDVFGSSLNGVDMNVAAYGDVTGDDLSVRFSDSSFAFSHDFIMNTALDVEISGGSIGFSRLVEIKAGGDLRIKDNARLMGGAVILTAGGVTQAAPDVAKNAAGEPGVIELNSTIEAGQLRVAAAGGIQSFGANTMSADAMDVLGSSIDLSSSTLNVGSGGSVLGFDPALLAQISDRAPGAAPSGMQPNASFLAFAGDVSLGDVNLFGDYLYVQGDAFDFNSISFENTLFFNYAPGNSGAPMDLTRSDFSGLPNGVTLAFGTSTYTGDILASTPDAFIDVGQADTNFIFATASPGTVTGDNLIRTNGRVVTINGASQLEEVTNTIADVITSQFEELTDPSPESDPPAEEDEDEDETESDSDATAAANTDDGISVEDSSGDEQGSSGCGI